MRIARAIVAAVAIASAPLVIAPMQGCPTTQTAEGQFQSAQTLYTNALGAFNDAFVQGLIDDRTFVAARPWVVAGDAALDEYRLALESGDADALRIARATLLRVARALNRRDFTGSIE